MGETLVRYGITILCIFTIDGLIMAFFEWGVKAMATGTVICLLFLLIKEVRTRLAGRKAKEV
jgi:hypothetical protein